MSQQSTPSSKAGWKALAIAFILGSIFLGFFYLAVSNEPDYMPSQQHKQNAQQHAFKQAPTMSEDALNRVLGQASTSESTPDATAAEHGMRETEHQNMNENTHGHGH